MPAFAALACSCIGSAVQRSTARLHAMGARGEVHVTDAERCCACVACEALHARVSGRLLVHAAHEVPPWEVWRHFARQATND